MEDTKSVTFERIEAEFGPAVRRIVEGETKMSKVGHSYALPVMGEESVVEQRTTHPWRSKRG